LTSKPGPTQHWYIPRITESSHQSKELDTVYFSQLPNKDSNQLQKSSEPTAKKTLLQNITDWTDTCLKEHKKYKTHRSAQSTALGALVESLEFSRLCDRMNTHQIHHPLESCYGSLVADEWQLSYQGSTHGNLSCKPSYSPLTPPNFVTTYENGYHRNGYHCYGYHFIGKECKWILCRYVDCKALGSYYVSRCFIYG